MIIKIFPPPKKKDGVCPRGFSRLLHYHEREHSELTHKENIIGDNAAELTQYFNEVSSRGTRVQDPVFHAVISFAYDEAEPSYEVISTMAQQYLKKLGYGNQPWNMYRHDDKQNIHFHIVSCRVDVRTGRGINNSFEYRRSHRIMTDLAAAFGYRVGNGQHQKVQLQESPLGECELIDVFGASRDVNMPENELLPPFTLSDGDRSSKKNGHVNQINEIVQKVLMDDQPYSMYRFIQRCRERGLEVKKLPRGYVVKLGSEYPIGLSKLPIFAKRRLSHILKENKQFRNREKRYISTTLFHVLRALPPLDMQYERAVELFAYKLQQLMAEHGVNVIYNANSSGITGVSFEHAGIILKGSELKQSWETIIGTIQRKSVAAKGGKTTTHIQQSGGKSRTLISGVAVGRRMSEDEEEKRREEELYRE